MKPATHNALAPTDATPLRAKRMLATRGDVNEAKAALRAYLAEAKTEIIKWCIGSMFASVALFATITKLWH